MRTLVLFTRDLRVHDHPALAEACSTSDDVLPLFVLDPSLLERSPNRTRFLFESLADLDRGLRHRFGRLIVRTGDVAKTCAEVARDAACDRVFVTDDVTRTARQRAAGLDAALSVELRPFPGNAVMEPGDVAPAATTSYRVFTPYHRAWAGAPRREVVDPPSRVIVPDDIPSDPLPNASEVVADSSDRPPGGETDGRRQLDAFLRTDLRHYAEGRDDLAGDATSRLSPYLRFGCVSANEVAARASTLAGGDAFVRQLAWRDFYRQLLAADPTLTYRDQHPAVDETPPSIDPGEALARWSSGATGLPLVDAGMRQLQREGWMHNRARMVVASFLTRRLGVAWQDGMTHFDRFLVDGDPPNNAGGWQWAAGTGTDPRRSRAFNPVRQSKRFDPNGDYIRRYVQELSDVPASRIHAPWFEERLLRLTGYPEPLLPVPGG